jgi:hypothetical protein
VARFTAWSFSSVTKPLTDDFTLVLKSGYEPYINFPSSAFSQLTNREAANRKEIKKTDKILGE